MRFQIIKETQKKSDESKTKKLEFYLHILLNIQLQIKKIFVWVSIIKIT